MKIRTIHVYWCITLLLVFTLFDSVAQSSFCNVSEKNIQNALDSRKGNNVDYSENVTIGVAFLLGNECDTALHYFNSALKVNQNSSLSFIVSSLKGNNPSAYQTVSTPTSIATSSTEPSLAGSIDNNNISKEVNREVASESIAKNENFKKPEETPVDTVSTVRSFSPEDLSAFQAKGLQKVRKLTENLSIIAQKSTTESRALSTIENSIELFDSENRTVQVSSLSKGEKAKMPVRTYLNRLRLLNYQKVTIEGASFTYVSKFIKGPDGNYYGVARFRQLFTGYRDNKPVYSDVTTKTVAVVLKPYKKAIEGESVEQWDVFLGDISVEQTETVK